MTELPLKVAKGLRRTTHTNHIPLTLLSCALSLSSLSVLSLPLELVRTRNQTLKTSQIDVKKGILSSQELSEVPRKLGVLSLKLLDVGIAGCKVGRFSWIFFGDTYPEDERIQGRHGGYDPSTYQF